MEDGQRINRLLVLSTLEQLLERQETVSTLDVLEALPTRSCVWIWMRWLLLPTAGGWN